MNGRSRRSGQRSGVGSPRATRSQLPVPHSQSPGPNPAPSTPAPKPQPPTPLSHPQSPALVCGDNLELLRSLPDGLCDLIYLDPPFASGDVRRTAKSTHAFDDRWTGGVKAFLAFMHARLVEMHRVLAAHGTLYVHLDWRAAAYVRVQLDTIFGAENFLNEIIWHYRTGGGSRRWFGRKHDTILVYARRLGRHRFNVLREGLYRTEGLKRDADGRPYKSTRKGKLYFHADGPALTDVWDIPFLSTVSLERCGWPTQKPLALLERIVRASSQPDDLVADFFCGSGTTLVAARRMGRRWLGCDESSAAVKLASQRLDACQPGLFDMR